MKKLLLIVLVAICAFSVFAAGKLTVDNERCFVIDDYWKYGYLFMRVVNAGDKPLPSKMVFSSSLTKAETAWWKRNIRPHTTII